MADIIDIWIFGLIGATLRLATPLILAALGGLFSERAGIVNIALEGLMIVGAFFAVWGSDITGSWIGGLAVAVLAGGVFSMLHAVATIHMKADQIISGTALLLLAGGFINYLNIAIYGDAGSPVKLSKVPAVSPDIPLIGGLSLLVPVTLGLIAATAYVIFKTPFGLRLRASGEHPRAADTVGIDVYRIRYIAVVVSGVLAALAGAYISLATGNNYTEGMTGGRGFIALAALIFGKWTPWGVLWASLLFGFAEAVGGQLQSIESVHIPPELVTSLPYVLTIVALAGFVGDSKAPAAVGKPYDKQGH